MFANIKQEFTYKRQDYSFPFLSSRLLLKIFKITLSVTQHKIKAIYLEPQCARMYAFIQHICTFPKFLRPVLGAKHYLDD